MKKIGVFLLTIVCLICIGACGQKKNPPSTNNSTNSNIISSVTIVSTNSNIISSGSNVSTNSNITSISSMISTTESSSITSTTDYKDEELIFALVNSYDVIGTNGFDYSVEQKLNNTVVNAHTISIRLDNTSDTIGSREEYIKKLNEDITQGQYTEVSATTYYQNNKIATYENDSWVWKNCQLNEFASVNINSFIFNMNKIKDLQVTASGKYYVLSFEVEDSKAASFLGVNGNIKNLTFEIKVNSNFDQLISLVISYSQELTTTKFSFVPYYGSVNINLPA